MRSSAGGSGAAQPQQRRFRYHETLAGKYRLEKSLARGGMGWVFLATQLPLGRQVAVKVLTPGQHDAQFRQRFLLEASTCAKLQHPNIVTIHDYGESERGDLFMAMEYLNGSSLSYLLARTGSLPVDRVLRIALQVTRALRVAHKAGVVHRDLKPANIMLLNHDDDTRDFVKVVDFGLAKLFQDKSDGGIDLTKAGTMLGSPRYMAPEQIRNDEVDPRTDIYSLGVIIFFMLTGRPPFMGNNATEILAQHLRDPVPNMAAVAGELEVPHELEQVVRRCLAKDPAGRYPTVDELVADLKAVQRSTSDRTLASDSFMEVVRPTSRLTEDLVVPFPDADVDVEVEPAQGQELPSNTAPVQHDVSGSQVVMMQPPPGSRAGVLVVVVALLALAAGGVWMWQRQQQPEARTPVAVTTTAPEYKTLVIRTDPAGLILVDEAGAELGTSPLTLPRPPVEHALRVRAVSGQRTSHLIRVIPSPDSEDVTLDLKAWLASPPDDDAKAVDDEPAVTERPRRRVAPRRSAARPQVEPEPEVLDESPAPAPVSEATARPKVEALDERPVTPVVESGAPKVGILDDGKPKIDIVDERTSGPSVGLVDEGEAPKVGLIEE